MHTMHHVESSNIEAIGHDAEAQELHVRFAKGGGTYVYTGVEAETFDEFMKADSKGSYLSRNIKGSYPFRKV